MRRNGVRGLYVTCQHCGHETVVNMDAWPDDVPVPSFGPRMRCSQCGELGAYRTGSSKLERVMGIDDDGTAPHH
jgi:ribosomal protein S27E